MLVAPRLEFGFIGLRRVFRLVLEEGRDLKELRDKSLGGVELGVVILFLYLVVSATEEAVRDGDTNEEKVEEFPVSGEE